jgi:(p)ppGpp synthase/HD superfamily hydrolase
METILQQIKDFADRSHGGQMRKYTPERYIVHPIRVMETCRLHDPRLPILAAALLHDVLEDTEVSPEEMLIFLERIMDPAEAGQTLHLVVELTDVYIKKDFPHLNRRARKEKELERIRLTSADAQTIKYADILDNTSEIVRHDRHFAPRFLKECLDNLKIADKGNSELRGKALQKVNEGLALLKNHGRIKDISRQKE